jgi:hypothetical protein
MNTTMTYTTMTTNNDHQQKPHTAAKTNLHFPAMNLFFLLFSTALLSDTRPLSHQNNLQKPETLIIQNRPNLCRPGEMITNFETVTYTNLDTWCKAKNEPNTNPIQTQTKPNLGKESPRLTAGFLSLPSAEAVVRYGQLNNCISGSFFRR